MAEEKFSEFISVSDPSSAQLVGYINNAGTLVNVQIAFNDLAVNFPKASTTIYGTTTYATNQDILTNSNSKSVTPQLLTGYTQPYTSDEKAKLASLPVSSNILNDNQTINGVYTFAQSPILSTLGASQVVLTDPSKALTSVAIQTGFNLPIGSGSGTIAAGNDSRIPSQAEKDALNNAIGIPSSTNPFILADNPVFVSIATFSNDPTLGGGTPSTTISPTQSAVKTYVSNVISTLQSPGAIVYFSNAAPTISARSGDVYFYQPDPVDGIAQDITVYQYNGTSWNQQVLIRQNISGTVGGDLSGTLPNVEVTGILGKSIPVLVPNGYLQVNSAGTGLQWVTISSNSGLFGIANGSGVYTYYSTPAAAYTAASAGQCVEWFTDYSDATGFTLKDSVNTDGHGHTYTVSASGIVSSIIDNGSAVNCQILNLAIKRTGGTFSISNSACLQVTSTTSRIKCSGVYLNNSFGVGLITSGEVDGLIIEAFNHGIYSPVVTGKCINSTSISTNAGYGIYMGAGSIYNCYGESKSLGFYGVLLNSNNAYAESCIGQSASDFGFYNSSGTAIGCIGRSSASEGYRADGSSINISCTGYSTASIGYHHVGNTGAASQRCTGYSTVNYGFANTSAGKIYDCTGIATSSAAFLIEGVVIHCNAISLFNNSAGHAFVINGSSATSLFQSYGEVSNTGANALNGTATVKYGQNTWGGNPTTAVVGTITQGEANTVDSQGNIKI